MTKRVFALVCLLLVVLWLSCRHVLCGENTKHNSQNEHNGDSTMTVQEAVQEKLLGDKLEQLKTLEEFENVASEDHTKEDIASKDITKDKNSEQVLNIPVIATDSNDLEKGELNLAQSFENISSSPTSSISSVSHPDAIENSSATLPVASSSEAGQSDSDCDIGGAVEVQPMNEPSFINPQARLVEQHTENFSVQHIERPLPSPESEERVSTPEGEKQPLPLNATDGTKNEKLDQKEVDLPAPGSTKDPVDIPTFDEWKKQVMEVEKEKSQSMHSSSNGGQHTVKVQKNRNNYASVECGAKILSANPEAKSTSAILIENMDLYMLNPCSTKIWFVIELCEPVQVKQLDIANYELFSSTPKDFLVSISDRYPTNKWVKLGTFHARDERNVQSFPLDEQMYAKYVKVELVSHFGSEHFCPLSLIRVFGTSMVEEYEEIVDPQYNSERPEIFDEDEDYPMDYTTRDDKSSKNLLGSATNAILSMVNNLLGASTEEKNSEGKELNMSKSDNLTSEVLGNDTAKTPEEISGHTLMEPENVTDPTIVVNEQLDVTNYKPIVQLVQEEEEEQPRQSTVTLLESDEQEEERISWYEYETQIYCTEQANICCISTFSEYIYKWCLAAETVHRQLGNLSDCKTIDDDTQLTYLPLANQACPSLEKTVPNQSEIENTDFILINSGDVLTSSNLNENDKSIDLEPSQTQSFSQTVIPYITEDVKSASSTPVLAETKTEIDLTSILTFSEILEVKSSDLKTSEVMIAIASSETENLSDTPEQNISDNIDIINITTTETFISQEATTFPVESELQETPKQVMAQTVDSLSAMEKKEDELAIEDISVTSGLPRSTTDFYAELQNSTELGYANGNQIHGSNQKESVFMRLKTALSHWK
ncbi:hypothetical protein GDO86_007679 [Hymenochirus boettgeri]|uniref:SUN domain-containing ossification factor n=1 Tax=Hymenochirus boettgeri TaxID=247094 RepID=A0A8T2J078_9PIPI|nr:hypothetical protein GDO86_007679 [Hymenochirus boettgeri]